MSLQPVNPRYKPYKGPAAGWGALNAVTRFWLDSKQPFKNLRAQVLERLLAVQPEAGHGVQCTPASGWAFVGLIARIDGLQAHGRSSSSGAGL